MEIRKDERAWILSRKSSCYAQTSKVAAIWIALSMLYVVSCKNVDNGLMEIKTWEVSRSNSIGTNETAIDSISSDNDYVSSLGEAKIEKEKLNRIMDTINEGLFEQEVQVGNESILIEGFSRVNYLSDKVGVLKFRLSKHDGYMPVYYCQQYGVLGKMDRRVLYRLISISTHGKSENVSALSINMLDNAVLSPPIPEIPKDSI